MADYHDLFHLTRVHSSASFFLQVGIKDTCINKMIDLEKFGFLLDVDSYSNVLWNDIFI